MITNETEAEPRLRTPWVVILLTAAIVASYAAFTFASLSEQNAIDFRFALIPERFDPASPIAFANWTEAVAALFGHAFLHLAWWHAGLNAFFFFATARVPALRIGWWRFLLVFFASALGGALAFVALNWSEETAAVGASGAVCGVFMAYFLSVRADWRESLRIPMVRNQALMIVFINVVLMGAASELGWFPIAWEGHLGGFVGGFLAYVLLAPRRRQGPWSSAPA
ncbi:MAG: rhomboid family intramembrane serine protease [Hyphomonadaceae bacterium]